MVWGFVVGLAVAGSAWLLNGGPPQILLELLGLPSKVFLATLILGTLWTLALLVAPNKLRGRRSALTALLERLASVLLRPACALSAIGLVAQFHAFWISEPAAHLQGVALSVSVSVCLALCSYSISSLADGLAGYQAIERT